MQIWNQCHKSIPDRQQCVQFRNSQKSTIYHSTLCHTCEGAGRGFYIFICRWRYIYIYSIYIHILTIHQLPSYPPTPHHMSNHPPPPQPPPGMDQKIFCHLIWSPLSKNWSSEKPGRAHPTHKESPAVVSLSELKEKPVTVILNTCQSNLPND